MGNKENNARNKTLAALNVWGLWVQKKLADWLNEKCRNLPGKTLMVMLIVFCSASTTLLIMLILGKL